MYNVKDNNMFSNKLVTSALTLLLAVSNQVVSAEKKSIISWPQEHWAVSTPQQEGVDEQGITSLVKEISTGTYGSVDHLIITRNGRIIADHQYSVDYDEILANSDTPNTKGSKSIPVQFNYDDTSWHPFFDGTNLHTLQSVTKSVTSLAFGIAIDKGLIKGVEQPIYPYFTKYKYDLTDPRKSEITIEDLLTMRTGIDWYTEGGYENNLHSTIIMENSNNWLQYILDRPMDRKPGTLYEYNDGSSVLLGKVLSEATGMRADKWTEQNLFKPIGINQHKWKLTPKGEADTEGGLYLSNYDLARVGYLFLRKGQWEDKQVVSEQWINQSVTRAVKDISPDNNRVSPGYGYQWYILEKNGALIYLGSGYGGQYLIVAPDVDIVIAVNSWSTHKKSKKSLYSVLMNIITSIKK